MEKDNYQNQQQFLINRIEGFISLVSIVTGGYNLGITRDELEKFKELVLEYNNTCYDFNDKEITFKLNEIYYKMGSIVAPIVGQVPQTDSRRINSRKM